MDETKFVIDLEGVNVAGINKVLATASNLYQTVVDNCSAPTVYATKTNITRIRRRRFI